ncbi:MAG: tetratricopeptide repeat protein [Chitinispirillaceae bacterium]|nr:tetratricopeptide repeat protein [Chitinispirillaceae bacterium]
MIISHVTKNASAFLSLSIAILSCGRLHEGDRSGFLYYEGNTVILSRGSGASAALLWGLVDKIDGGATYAPLTIDYPFEGSIFPPEIMAPEFLWHDTAAGVEMWMAAVRFKAGSARIYSLLDGNPPVAVPLDSECIRDNNRYEEPAYWKSARAWMPESVLWDIIKKKSRGQTAMIDLYGIAGHSRGSCRPVSHGRVCLRTSKDSVGAPIFYRDVPLMPARNPNGVIQPLSQDAVPLIVWRLRDIAKPAAAVVMKRMSTCINCHSFSADGRTLGMDMDGPNGDKGSYALVPIGRRMVIERSNVFSWNTFDREKPTFGLFSSVSPDGRYIVSAVDEEVHVVNYTDFRFLQTFYPTGGRIAWYDRLTKKINVLPGADRKEYVQCNPVWSHDGQWVAFLRAKSRPAFNGSVRAIYANDSLETQIRYDLYRVPFNGGRGGTPQPVQGACATGKSVSFPKYSPDGKWIVFVQANNGLLMRPDSRLYIIPAGGGEARELACNLPLMNSWHSWSPNGRWLVFSSKAFTPYTQMLLTHIDEDGNASPAILVPHSTAANRAVNLPEFVNVTPDGIVAVEAPATAYKVYLDKAKKRLEAGSIDSAYAEISKAIELRPDFAENYATLSLILAQKGDLAAAKEASLEALKHDPSNDVIQVAAGMLLYAGKKNEAAIRHFETALKLNPNRAITYYYYGLALEATRRPGEALGNYNTAVALDPQFSDAYNNRGTLLYALKKTDEAIEDYSRAIATVPKTEYCRNRGIARTGKNQFTAALADFAQAIRLNPDDGATYFARGNTHLRMGNTAAALADFKTALNCKQICLQALAPFCDIHSSTGMHRRLIEELDVLIARQPDNAVVVNRRAVAFMRTGDVVKALRDFDIVLAKAPSEPSVYFNRALCYEKFGDIQSAVKNYRLALRYASPSAQQREIAHKRIRDLQR